MTAMLEQERTKRLIAMGEMAASLAHEIRNPLGSMELFCTLLKRDLSKQPELLTLAEQIHGGIRTLDRIISNCLQFARDAKPHRRPVDNIGAFLDEVLSDASAKIQGTGVTVAVQSSGAGRPEVDRYQLKQALVNLLLNAVDAVVAKRQRDGSMDEPAVILRSEIERNWRLSVIDRGAGISEETRAKIFDPFFTTKDAGTGLGLAIVHSIVTAHQGTILLESSLGEGATFTVEIPLQYGGA